MIDQSVFKMWASFIAEYTYFTDKDLPDSWYFCDNEKDANECADLVVSGDKRATASSLWWYETTNEPFPQLDDLYIITNWAGIAKAIIRVTKIEKVPYNEITQKFAETEGEGDKSLEYWKQVHYDYYSREMNPSGVQVTDDMIIVCEYFEKVFG